MQFALAAMWLDTKAMRDARLNQIYEGTNQINLLAFVEAFWDSDLAPGPRPDS